MGPTPSTINPLRLLCAALLWLLFAAAMPTVSHAIDTPEIEPNESKAAATTAAGGGGGMANIDTISGTTTGSAGIGAASADYFKVRTIAAASSIYRYELVLTSATPGHILSLRGLSQSLGVINVGSDVTFQTGAIGSPNNPLDSRMVKWYGFGAAEELFIRITGTNSTTAPYTILLKRTVIAPVVVAGAVFDGKVITSRGIANLNDVDQWMYNPSLLAIAGYGNDQPNTLSRTYTPGIYYIAMSDSNVGNNLESPIEDGFRSGNVLDFDRAIACESANIGLNMDAKVVSAAGTGTGAGIKSNPFDILWYCFNVVPNTILTVPQGSAAASPSMASNCGDAEVCFQVFAVPGANPPSAGLSVSINLSTIGGPVNFTLADNGTDCDPISGDLDFARTFLIPTFATPGIYDLPYSIRDAQNRTFQGVLANFVIEACPLDRPANDLCESAIAITSLPASLIGSTNRATSDSGVPNCVPGSSDVSAGVWYKITGNGRRITVRTCASRSSFNSVINVYCGANGCDELFCVAGGDDECRLLSSVTWCSDFNAPYFILVRGAGPSDQGIFTLEAFDNGSFCTDPVACLPRGGCCINDTCIETTAPLCGLLEGEYLGDHQPCTQLVATTRYRTIGGTPRQIPDGVAAGIILSLTVPPTSEIVTDLAVGIQLEHPWIGDLVADLTHNSTTVTLFSRVGRPGTGFGDSSNLSGEYCFAIRGKNLWSVAAGQGNAQLIAPDIYKTSRALNGAPPAPDLSVFNGQPFAGTWTLRLRDLSTGEVGQMTGFSLKTTREIDRCSVCPSCPADFNVDGGVDGQDVFAFFVAWQAANPCADANQDGGIDGMDVQTFFEIWQAGGC